MFHHTSSEVTVWNRSKNNFSLPFKIHFQRHNSGSTVPHYARCEVNLLSKEHTDNHNILNTIFYSCRFVQKLKLFTIHLDLTLVSPFARPLSLSKMEKDRWIISIGGIYV